MLRILLKFLRISKRDVHGDNCHCNNCYVKNFLKDKNKNRVSESWLKSNLYDEGKYKDE